MNTRAHALTGHVVAAVLLAIATLLNYLAWLGWDQQKDVRPDGSMSGPYQAWQVAGLVIVLGVLAAAGTWRGHAIAAVISITAMMTLAFSVDAMTDPQDQGLWPIGAALVCIGTFLGTAAVAALGTVAKRRFGSATGLFKLSGRGWSRSRTGR